MPAIVTRSLSKRYGDIQALSAVDLSIDSGEVYALLGRNGAGKTTCIRMMLGLIRPSAGWVEILGTRIGNGKLDVFAQLGYLVETAVAYPNLTVRENLEIQRRLVGAEGSSTRAVIERLGLATYADRLAGQLSLGNLQRLALARAVLHRPRVLILDEPTNALDPSGIAEIRVLLREMASADGVAVFISSHILAEVAQVADQIAILHHGHLLEEMNSRAMREREQRYVEVAVSDAVRAMQVLIDGGFRRVDSYGAMLRLYEVDGREAAIAPLLVNAGIEVTAIVPSSEGLESYFLRRTEGPL